MICSSSQSQKMKVTEDVLAQQQTLGILDFVPRSPDLNPIERRWSIIQQQVSAYGPLTREQLQTYVVKCSAKRAKRT